MRLWDLPEKLLMDFFNLFLTITLSDSLFFIAHGMNSKQHILYAGANGLDVLRMIVHFVPVKKYRYQHRRIIYDRTVMCKPGKLSFEPVSLTTMNLHAWLLRPDGAHRPASIISSSALSFTISSVNSRTLRLDFIASATSI